MPNVNIVLHILFSTAFAVLLCKYFALYQEFSNVTALQERSVVCDTVFKERDIPPNEDHPSVNTEKADVVPRPDAISAENLHFASDREPERPNGALAENQLSESVDTNLNDEDEIGLLVESGSSVWCRGEDISRRLCRFKNLCIDPTKDEFIFLHGPNSIISGLDSSSHKQPVADLSSVQDHNLLQLVLTDIPVEKVRDIYRLNVIAEPSFLLYRFKPDNLMHIFHDDLLPLFHTLLELCGGSSPGRCPQQLRLAQIDPWPEGPHGELYNLFSPSPPLIISENLQPQTLLCFKDAYVGLNKKTLWYQYGFQHPQGPWSNKTATAIDVHRFTDYFLEREPKIDLQSCTNEHFAILLSRKNTRIIINEEEVINAISTSSGLKVQVLSLDENTLMDVVNKVHCADILIGMHGALLVLSMFLKPGSIFIELYPYAIPPEEYTPYKTLATLPGMGIIYKSWRNEHLANTVTHPDWPADLGGISHLTLREQQDIESYPEVPPHLCCDNALWLYRIYQDTQVDISSFQKVLQEALQEQVEFSKTEHKNVLEQLNKEMIFPGKVENLSCLPVLSEPALNLSWRPPVNLQTLQTNNIAYEVWTQVAEQEYKLFLTNETKQILRALPVESNINIWVRCMMNDKLGVFNWVSCMVEDKNAIDITY